MINDEYHTQYDFMRFVYLSYLLPVSRRADPISGLSGFLALRHDAILYLGMHGVHGRNSMNDNNMNELNDLITRTALSRNAHLSAVTAVSGFCVKTYIWRGEVPGADLAGNNGGDEPARYR